MLMDRREKIERARNILNRVKSETEEGLLLLSQVLGELDAIHDYADFQRSKLKIIVGGKEKSEHPKKE